MNNLQLPGPFVVFQGIPGDGVCNTLLQEDDEEYFFDRQDDDDDDDDAARNTDDDDVLGSLLYACPAQDDDTMEESNPLPPLPPPPSSAQCEATQSIHRRKPPAAVATSSTTPSTSSATATTTTTFLGQGFLMNPASFSAAATTTVTTSAPTLPGGLIKPPPSSGTLRRRITAPSTGATSAVSASSATTVAAAATATAIAARPTILPPINIGSSGKTDDTDTTTSVATFSTATMSNNTTFSDMEASLAATAARIAAAVASPLPLSPPPLSQQQQISSATVTNATTRSFSNTNGIYDDEDFVVVNDRTTSRSTTSSSSETPAATVPSTLSQQQQSTSITADNATSSILPHQNNHQHQHDLSQPQQQHSQQMQHQQEHHQRQPGDVVDDNNNSNSHHETRTRNKTIQLWKTASRTRVAHLHKEWFSNCQATAPNLTTMDIQPWLISSSSSSSTTSIISSSSHAHGGITRSDNNHNDRDDNDHHHSKKTTLYELAVFDRLPTNTSLLQNHYKSKTTNSVVLPTAKIVGSLAPGMTVVGTAITTFEVVLPNNNNQYYYSRNNNNNNSHSNNNNNNNFDCSHPQQSQAPACLVVANALDAALLHASSRLEFCQHETFHGGGVHVGVGGGGAKSDHGDDGPLLVPQQGRLQFLHLSATDCFHDECVVLYSIHGYTVLGAGLSSVYAQPDVWYWKVTCPVGAYVREGLDLTTHLKEVLPYGTVCQVQRKTVNAHGLARLSIRAILPLDDDSGNGGDEYGDEQYHGDATFQHCHDSAGLSATAAPFVPTTSTATASSSSLSRQNSSNYERRQRARLRQHQQPQRDSPCRLVEGWCSQFLNPMSGQGGSVVQPIPFCVPAVYRITLPEGAVVRQEIELTSPQIGHIPCGAVVTATERAFSEFPTDKCIERLRLAPGTSFCNGTGAGWISIRLNKKFPEDRLIVQYVGLDNSFDHRHPGLFHYQQACAASALATSNTTTEQQHQPPLLDHERLRDGSSSQHQFNHPQHQVSTTPTIHEISSIDENESRCSMSSSGGGGGGFGSGNTLPMTTTATSAATAVLRDPHHPQHPPLSTNDHRRRRRPDTPDNSCLCCIDKTRNATMVHGDTGHIACCLDCARMLKASGQPCPVCRLPIDLVILHYWA